MHHRAGLLKQSNKGHGTLGHKSKRSVENINRGRVGLKDNVGKKFKTLESRKERRNKSKQVWLKKTHFVFLLKIHIFLEGQASPTYCKLQINNSGFFIDHFFGSEL